MRMRIYCVLIALLHAGLFERRAKAFSSPSGFSSLEATSQLFTRVQSQHHHTGHSCRDCCRRRGLFMRDPQEKGKAKKRKQQQQKQKGDKGFSGERAPRVDPNAPISVRKQINWRWFEKMHEASASNDNGGDRPVLNPADALKMLRISVELVAQISALEGRGTGGIRGAQEWRRRSGRDEV